ncbi:hypothetical protein [Pontiella sulfatireligans]|nr:hypothetical protein [Pontiella sulfatireligans]
MKPEILTGIAAIISAGTALVAVFIGPLVTAKINRQDSLSAMREKWIADLRETLSEIISTAETASSIIVQSRAIEPNFKEAYNKLVLLEGKAKMMLNPREVDHNSLEMILDSIVQLAGDESIKIKEKMPQMRELTESVIPVAQAVLKEAWERTK